MYAHFSIVSTRRMPPLRPTSSIPLLWPLRPRRP
jgi:hypothetical protein